MINLLHNLKTLQHRIHSAEQQYGRSPGSVSLIVVCKSQSLQSIAAIIDAGQYELGENYLQEALPKISALGDQRLIWHFLGPIQSNKAREIAQNFSWVHTVSRVNEAQRLSHFRSSNSDPLNICIQIKLDENPAKSGASIESVPDLVETIQLLPRLRLRGFMTILPQVKSFQEQRAYFKQIKNLFLDIKLKNTSLDTLSMGMSQDFEAAIAEGATMVRIGSAIFGPRGKIDVNRHQ